MCDTLSEIVCEIPCEMVREIVCDVYIMYNMNTMH